MVQHYLLKDEVLIVFFFETIQFEIKVKRTDRFHGRFVLWVMQLRHIRVLQSSVDRDSLVGVEGQHLTEQVNGIGVSSFEHCIEILALSSGKRLNEFFVFSDLNFVDEIVLRVSDEVSDNLDLFFLGGRREEGLASD